MILRFDCHDCTLEKNCPARLRGQGRKLLLQYFDGLACYQERTSLMGALHQPIENSHTE